MITKSAVSQDQKALSEYPGGKSKALKQMLPYLPTTEAEVVSVFLGGGSVELALCESGVQVHGYDNYSALVTFWQMLLRDPEGLARRIERLLVPKLRRMGALFFRRLQAGISLIDDPLDRAACFFLLNRACFLGSTQADGKGGQGSVLGSRSSGFCGHWSSFSASRGHVGT